jgi:hypothetical protein
MPSATYALFRRAILERKLIVCRYQGKRREIAPHILGFKNRIEKALVSSSAARPIRRCRRAANGAAFHSRTSWMRSCSTARGIPADRTG